MEQQNEPIKKWSAKGRLLKANKKTADIASYRHQWYEANKEKCLKTMSREVVCTCGLTVKYSNLCKHIHTNKHEYYLGILNGTI